MTDLVGQGKACSTIRRTGGEDRWTITLLIAAFIAITAGCGNPLDGGDGAASPTSDQEATTPSNTPAPLPTDTPSPTASPSPTGTTATSATAGTAVATDATPGPTPTPTQVPLPSNGAELSIENAPVTRIVQGNDSGRTLYAVANDQLWRTNDGGRTWAEAGDIWPLVVALNELNVLYTGDRGSCGRGFSFHDFQRSSDAGRTWETVEANRDIQPLLAYESAQDAIVYGTNCGLSVSADSGDSWITIPDLNGEEVFAAATERSNPMSQVVVVSATEGGTGRLFLLDTSEPAQPQFVGALAQFWGDAVVDWTDGRIVLAHAHQVGVSDDGGETWSWSRQGLEDATYSVDPLLEAIPEDEMDPFRRFEAVRIDPINRDRIWLAGNHGAFLSTDGGQTWGRVGDDVPITGLAISTLSDRVLISSETGARLWTLDAS